MKSAGVNFYFSIAPRGSVKSSVIKSSTPAARALLPFSTTILIWLCNNTAIAIAHVRGSMYDVRTPRLRLA